MTRPPRQRTITGIATTFILLATLVTGALAMPYPGTWIRVDTDASVAEIREGDRLITVLEHVAFGRGGISALHLRGDNTTPTGRFRINRINRDSRFHLFFAINYPTIEHLDAARRGGIVGEDEYTRALDYAGQRGYLPQDGPLGGHIGFHGIGDGDPVIHEDFHWTEGCIAMTNEQIEQFDEFVEIGTPVVIE
jgi:hypothetical protein